jgi:60 kDa SS-A/Ro ribonucleoprotein
LKYQNRYGWTGRDVLRTVKPKPFNPGQDLIFKWIVGKAGNMDEYHDAGFKRIEAYNWMCSEITEDSLVSKWIRELNLTHEMIPAGIERTKVIWEALFEKMPIGATLRNLGNLTNKGVFSKLGNIDILEDRFTEKRVKSGRLHPLSLVSANVIYGGGGDLGRSKLTWKSIGRIHDILDNATNYAFESLEPTGKMFFHAIDISPSMTMTNNEQLWMTAADIAGVMATATVKAEKNYFVGGFAKTFVPLPMFTKNMRYKDAFTHRYRKDLKIQWGGTDASSAYQHAIDNNMVLDVFCFWTDNESWIGYHPAVKLKEYRNKINPNAKAIYITLVPYGDKISLVDPKDDKSYDLAGFSSETVKLIQLIAEGTL